MLCDNMLPGRAYELGLVNRVVPDDNLLEEAMALAERLAGWNKLQLWQTKRVFQRSPSMDMDKAQELARDVSVMMGRFPA
jgi:enoyl-CoA hydratase/carnithine racemase